MATASKADEFKLVDTFPLTYRAREDITKLPPGVLIVGSQNVLSNVSDRIQLRQGYALDGDTSTIAAAIESSFDWQTRGNGEVHMRSGFLTEAGDDGKLQYRYVGTGSEVIEGEIVTNGSFTGSATGWNLGTGWAYNANNVLHTPGNDDEMDQSLTLSVNKSYRVTATIGGSVGTVTIEMGGTSQTFLAGAGVVTFNVLSSESDSSINFEPDTDFDGTIDSVSVVRILTSGEVNWQDLLIDLTTVNFNFCTYWNVTENLRETLFVDGSSNIYEWDGATAVIASTGADTITKTGTDSWEDAGFYVTANKSLVINGNTYTYSGGEDTDTLTGVMGDPTGEPIGSIVTQSVVITANTDMTDITETFPNGLIANLNNQIFVGALTSAVLWISKVNDFTDYSSSTPRQTGEGASLILDDNLVALIRQEQFMYVSAGKDLWYNVNFELQTSTVGVTYEQVNAELLKNGRRQGAQSQAFTSHMKNNVITVTFEPTIDMIGRIQDYFETPQTKNISDSIKLLVDQLNFTGGSIFYYRYQILVAVPQEGIVLIYSLNTNSWEAPQTLPITRFYVVEGELYGHSSATSESYQLFTGYADRVYPGFSGYPIDSKAVFSYQNFGTRAKLKKANMFYIEGYISGNTTLLCTLTYEIDGCATTKTFEVDGSDKAIVCIPSDSDSLGKVSLGKQKLGGDGISSVTGLPPKFRVEKTFPSTNFFECSFSFEVLGVSQNFQILAYGLNASLASEEEIYIRQ